MNATKNPKGLSKALSAKTAADLMTPNPVSINQNANLHERR